jgi:periplasmic glucans biosynthesis protein
LRHCWIWIAACIACTPTQGTEAMDLDELEQRARQLAAEPYRDDTPNAVPPWLNDLSYDQWRDIRFRPAEALWAKEGLPYRVQFFHPGLFYGRPVHVHQADESGVRSVQFSPSQFDYGKNEVHAIPADLGYAGLRVLTPLNRPEVYDELIVFLGASYFRAVAKDLGFGLTARGLAIDTAIDGKEEFPLFREFWLVRPTSPEQLMLLALLDSPRATGAYQFVIRPGSDTVVSVEARLFLRAPVKKLGLAPLTSMFVDGENSVTRLRSFRPETHDSDGLLLQSAATGERLWRPIERPGRVRTSIFQVEKLAGFGLLQRDRDFDHYQDLETRAERRPSAWITPRGDWGAGAVELVELPTDSEHNDNIVAFWIPARQPAPGERLAFAYDLHWYGTRTDPAPAPAATVTATRRDAGTKEGDERFIIDFAGERLAELAEDSDVHAVVTVAGGDAEAQLLEQQVFKNPVTNGWRLVFQVRPLTTKPIELRAFLQQGDQALSETWSYAIEP